MTNFTELTYEEWCQKYQASAPDSARNALMELHGLNLDDELEQIRKSEYNAYICRIRTSQE
jgi:hypothetical protein